MFSEGGEVNIATSHFPIISFLISGACLTCSTTTMASNALPTSPTCCLKVLWLHFVPYAAYLGSEANKQLHKVKVDYQSFTNGDLRSSEASDE